MECKGIQFERVKGCPQDLRDNSPNGTYSFYLDTKRVELNGNFYGEIESFTDSSFFVKRRSLNKYIDGTIIEIKTT